MRHVHDVEDKTGFNYLPLPLILSSYRGGPGPGPGRTRIAGVKFPARARKKKENSTSKTRHPHSHSPSPTRVEATVQRSTRLPATSPADPLLPCSTLALVAFALPEFVLTLSPCDCSCLVLQATTFRFHKHTRTSRNDFPAAPLLSCGCVSLHGNSLVCAARQALELRQSGA